MDSDLLKKIRQMSDNDLVEIALRVAAHDTEVFARNMLAVGTWVFMTEHNIPLVVSDDVTRKLRAVWTPDRGHLVQTIKTARELTGISLKNAKDLVEHMEREGMFNK